LFTLAIVFVAVIVFLKIVNPNGNVGCKNKYTG